MIATMHSLDVMVCKGENQLESKQQPIDHSNLTRNIMIVLVEVL